MTYAEALTLRAQLEAALRTGAGIASLQIGDRQVVYSKEKATNLLAQINRDILTYERRASNINPEIRRPQWK